MQLEEEFRSKVKSAFAGQTFTGNYTFFEECCHKALYGSRRSLDRFIGIKGPRVKEFIDHIRLNFSKKDLYNPVHFIPKTGTRETKIDENITKIERSVEVDYYYTNFSTSDVNKKVKSKGRDWLAERREIIKERTKTQGVLITDPFEKAFACFIKYNISFKDRFHISKEEFRKHINNPTQIRKAGLRKQIYRCLAMINGVGTRKKNTVSFFVDERPYMAELKWRFKHKDRADQLEESDSSDDSNTDMFGFRYDTPSENDSEEQLDSEDEEPLEELPTQSSFALEDDFERFDRMFAESQGMTLEELRSALNYTAPNRESTFYPDEDEDLEDEYYSDESEESDF